MSKIVIRRQFCGPPNSGNGGYVCGVLARDIVGPATAVLRAPFPLDVVLALGDRDEGRALLGTMTGEITKPVQSGADYIVLAWPLEAEGRKRTAGVALFDAEGHLVARAHQVWITMTARPPGAI